MRDFPGERTLPAFMRPTFSIITPSFRQLDWLKLCAASIADQAGVRVEHLVQDAGSGETMLAWAAEWKRKCETEDGRFSFQLAMEKDDGMYDAVNRGLRRASGELLAYLNCDEQYLPGALATVADYFAKNPAVDVAFAHAVVVDAQGGFRCCRKAIPPGRLHTWVSGNLATLTCATFFRRKVLDEHALFFDPTKRAIGDGVWVMGMLEKNIRPGIVPALTSAFVDDGRNLMLSPEAVREQRALVASAPAWARAARAAIIAHYRARKWWHGAYRQEPLDYAIYTAASPDERVVFPVEKPSFRWVR